MLSMFINSCMATIGKYCDVPVYSGKMSWYSVLFRDIPEYSVIFRHIPWYSGIPGFHNAPQNGNNRASFPTRQNNRVLQDKTIGYFKERNLVRVCCHSNELCVTKTDIIWKKKHIKIDKHPDFCCIKPKNTTFNLLRISLICALRIHSFLASERRSKFGAFSSLNFPTLI
jgi:hypothetical protein